MDFKTLLKSTEGAVVLGGIFLIVTIGKLFAYLTAIAYIAVNVPNFKAWIKKQTNKVKDAAK